MTLMNELAGLEYAGVSSVTRPCVLAIASLLQQEDAIVRALLLTHGSEHAFLLIDEYDRVRAIKNGFASGYRGEGPSVFL